MGTTSRDRYTGQREVGTAFLSGCSLEPVLRLWACLVRSSLRYSTRRLQHRDSSAPKERRSVPGPNHGIQERSHEGDRILEVPVEEVFPFL
jgi:hypothetical protein